MRADFIAAQRRQQDDHDRAMHQAWQTIYIYFKTKKDRRMPPLKPMLSAAKRVAARPKTWAEQRGVLHQLSAQYGIPVRPRKV